MPWEFRRMTFKEYFFKRRGYFNKEARRQDHDRYLTRRLIYVVARLGYGQKSPFADESDVFSLSWERAYQLSRTEAIIDSYPDLEQQQHIAELFNKAFSNNGNNS